MVVVEAKDAAALAEAAADLFARLAAEAIAARGRFNVALSGGSTPRVLHARLSAPDAKRAARLDWTRVHVFWGDERCVPPDHPDSNYRMARETLLDRVPLPAANVHRIHGELPPERAAAEYERALRAYFGDGSLPRFDLILLGLGEDGHTASLFPGSAALGEAARWAVAVPHSDPPPPPLPRVSLTLPVLNAAAQVVFLVSGAGKAQRLAQVLRRPGESLPAGRVHPTGGLLWLVDAAAAQDLKEADEH